MFQGWQYGVWDCGSQLELPALHTVTLALQSPVLLDLLT